MKCLRDAMTDYKHAIELDPEYALAYYNAANIYLHGRFFQQVCVSVEVFNLHSTQGRATPKIYILAFFQLKYH